MSPIAPVLAELGAAVAELTQRFGRRVNVEAMGVTDRHGHLALAEPGRVSPNGSCRLIRAADGWLAVNLARDEDRSLILPWLEGEADADDWSRVEAAVAARAVSELRDRAALLGLPAAQVGEVAAERPQAHILRIGEAGVRRAGRRLRVIDLSALWAGPLCGAILAEAGADVTRIESRARPDPSRLATPEFYDRLNRRKAHVVLDFAEPGDRDLLRQAVSSADVLITSARPRAFAGLGLDPSKVFAANPGIVWAAVSGYGWSGAGAERVAFGDDAAAGGGLVRWAQDGAPLFLGDALADPVTGLAAAIGVLKGLEAGGGVLVDAALALCAAGAASRMRAEVLA